MVERTLSKLTMTMKILTVPGLWSLVMVLPQIEKSRTLNDKRQSGVFVPLNWLVLPKSFVIVSGRVEQM